MRGALDEISTPVPQRTLCHIVIARTALQEQQLPTSKKGTNVVGERQFVGWRSRTRGFSGHDKSVKRMDIVISKMSEMVVRKRGIEVAPFAVNSIAQRSAECLHRPVADSCF